LAGQFSNSIAESRSATGTLLATLPEPRLFRSRSMCLVRWTSAMERRVILVRGIVQGVGFRPFVYNLATRLALRGFVKNQTGSVHIEVEGDPPSLENFLSELVVRPPPLAQVEHLSWQHGVPQGDDCFHIAA